MTAPGSVPGITPLSQLAPRAPNAVMDALQQLRVRLAPFEQPVEVPVAPADPEERMRESIEQVNTTVTARTTLRRLPQDLLALSDQSKDERRHIQTNRKYSPEGRADELDEQLGRLVPRALPVVQRVAGEFGTVRTEWLPQRQPGEQLLVVKNRPDIWDFMRLVLGVPVPAGLGVVEDLVVGGADPLLLENVAWALAQRGDDARYAERAFAVEQRVRAKVLEDAGRAHAYYGAAYATALLRGMKRAAEALFTQLLLTGTLDVVVQQQNFPWFTTSLPADPVALLRGALPSDADRRAELLKRYGLRDVGSTGRSGEQPAPLRLPESTVAQL